MLSKLYCFLPIILLSLAKISLFAEQAPSPRIKAVVFDFSGVIAKTDKKQIGAFIAQELGVSEEEAMQAQAKLKIYIKEGGEEENFWLDYAKSIGRKLPDNWMEKLSGARSKSIKDIPGMKSIVKQLQAQGFQTPLLSNVRTSQAAIKRQLGYYNMFSPVLLSSEIGVLKPDPKIYRILLDTLKLPPENILFIDNRPNNVEAAKAMGIDAVVFTNPHQLVEDLKARGIRVSIEAPEQIPATQLK